MLARLKGDKDIAEMVLDYTVSQFSSDEIIKQIALRLHDNPMIHTLIIENAELYEKGAVALRQAVLGHPSLRQLSLYNLKICSYYITVSEEISDYFFPKDLDQAVAQVCAILRDARLNTIEMTELNFIDRTERHFQHVDMVEPAQMRDLVLQEKQPEYITQIAESLNHNPHLYCINLSIDDVDVNEFVEEIEKNIRRRHASEELNLVLEGTHAAIETRLIPEIFKFYALRLWWQGKMQNRMQKLK